VTGSAIRVVIADDHPPTRLGVKRTLEDVGMDVVAECGDGETAVALAVEHDPDLCLLDLHMPGGGGLKATAEITAALPATPVVILTVSRDDDDLLAALKAGAVGYLLKDMDPGRLGKALMGVLEGEAAIPRELVTRVVDAYRDRGDRRVRTSDGRMVSLSAREHDIMTMLADGLTTAEMAERLVVAPVTVRTHISSLLRKLNVPDRETAIQLVLAQR
jgi:two-component system, NarL family, nitrate/nitrite response regulator NarL